MLGEQPEEQRLLCGLGGALQDPLPEILHTLAVGLIWSGEDLLGEGPRGLHEDRIVEQGESRQGRVRTRPLGGAALATGGVEGREARVDELALPVAVEGAAVEGAVGGVSLPLGDGDNGPPLTRLMEADLLRG